MEIALQRRQVRVVVIFLLVLIEIVRENADDEVMSS